MVSYDGPEGSYDGGVVRRPEVCRTTAVTGVIQRPRGVVRQRCRTTPGGVVTTVVSYDTSRRRTTPPLSSHRTLGNQRPINVDYLFGACLAVASSSGSSVLPPALWPRVLCFKFRPSCTWHAASCTLAKKATQTGILKLPCLMRSPRKATPISFGVRFTVLVIYLIFFFFGVLVELRPHSRCALTLLRCAELPDPRAPPTPSGRLRRRTGKPRGSGWDSGRTKLPNPRAPPMPSDAD